VNGKDKAPGTKWVTPAVLDTFNVAITAAGTVNDDDDATQNTIDGAVSTLDTAKGVFTSAIKDVANGNVTESGVTINL
jgi:hypothetical protein